MSTGNFFKQNKHVSKGCIGLNPRAFQPDSQGCLQFCDKTAKTAQKPLNRMGQIRAFKGPERISRPCVGVKPGQQGVTLRLLLRR